MRYGSRLFRGGGSKLRAWQWVWRHAIVFHHLLDFRYGDVHFLSVVTCKKTVFIALEHAGIFTSGGLVKDKFKMILCHYCRCFIGYIHIPPTPRLYTRCHIRPHLSTILQSKSTVDGYLSPAKVVANIPLNISTDVVKQLLPMGDIFSEVILFLQDEARQRLVDPTLKSSEFR